MAALNIKNFPDALYDRLKVLAGQQHRSVSQQVIHLLSQIVEKPEPASILELGGLGKEIWEGIEPDDFVAKERSSWD